MDPGAWCPNLPVRPGPSFLWLPRVLPADYSQPCSSSRVVLSVSKGAVLHKAVLLPWGQLIPKEWSVEAWQPCLSWEQLSFRAIKVCFPGNLTNNSWCQQWSEVADSKLGFWSWVTTSQLAVKPPIPMVGEVLTVPGTGRFILVELSQVESWPGMPGEGGHGGHTI